MKNMYSYNTERGFMCLCRGSITFNTQLAGPWQGRSLRGWVYLAPLPEMVLLRNILDFFPCFQSWDVHKPREKASLKYWSGIFVALEVHVHLAPRWLSADGVMFQLLCPIWVREWTRSQKSLRWQHPGTSSLPRQPTAWSILPSLILDGVCLLAHLRKGTLHWGSAFTMYLLPVPPGQVHLWQHTISVGDLKQLNLQVGDTPRLLGVWTRAGWRQKCLHCTQSWGQVAFQ